MAFSDLLIRDVVKPDTLNLVEEEEGKSLECIGMGDDVLNKADTKITINKQDLIMLNS